MGALEGELEPWLLRESGVGRCSLPGERARERPEGEALAMLRLEPSMLCPGVAHPALDEEEEEELEPPTPPLRPLLLLPSKERRWNSGAR